ncbi:hypothetical protein GIV19_02115 [Pseudomonas syringae]|nr:hypothetical protein [Pseudomonas syringae]
MLMELTQWAVEESKNRVRSAIQNSQQDFPVWCITLNLRLPIRAPGCEQASVYR